MNAALHPLAPLKESLREIAARRDVVRLGECLRGMHLPALGGAEHPAHLIHRALTLPPFDPRLGERLAGVMAELSAERLPGDAQGAGESYLFNLFLFASLLPADAALFGALERFERGGPPSDIGGRVARQLRQALTFQQTDARLEPLWLGMIEAGEGAPLSGERQTELLDGWQGLLWIPVPADAELPFELARLERGLLGIHRAGDPSEVAPLLRYALHQLDEAYPASPEFWHQLLGERLAGWPGPLRELVAERWPGSGTGVAIPEEAREAWAALTEAERGEIERLAESGEPGAWKALWGRLKFMSPRDGIARQNWIGLLSRIEQLFEAAHAELGVEEGHESIEVLAERETVESRAVKPVKRRKGKGKGIDRHKALERVEHVMESIGRLLRQGNPERAASYLDELVAAQRAEGTEDAIVAKTLANAATLAREGGEYEWAEGLYRRAQTLAPEDAVPCAGLAELFRAQCRVEEAETLYRETAGRWPDDVVAHTGLAETLREQGRLKEAETLYRETSGRWPDDVVARNGWSETLREQGRLEEAETLYRKTASRWFDNVVAHTGLAETLREQGRLEEAETLYRETAGRWPGDVVAHTGLAETLREQGRLVEAETLYRETAGRWPNDAVARNGWAETLREQGRLVEAETLYRETAGRWPADVVVRNGLAEILREQGRLEEAETLYCETADRWPYNVVARNGWAEILREQGRLDEAETLYRETASRWPADVVARNGWAETLREQGRLVEAEALYRESTHRWPNDGVARHGLANTLRKLRRFEEALVLLPEPATLSTKRSRYDLHLRAMILLETDRPGEAAALFRRGLAERLPPKTEKIFRNALVLAELKLRRFQEAAELLAGSSDDSPAANVIRLHAFAAAGRRERAREVHAGLQARILHFPSRVTTPLRRIEAAYCVGEEGADCAPDDAEFDAIVADEIEMLLAA